jgi:hypothetical protein
LLSEEVTYLNIKSSRIEIVLASDGSNYQDWKYDIEIYADLTVKYGREILKGDKITVRTKDSVDLYDPRTDSIKCAKLEQEVLSKVQKDWKVFFMNERAQYDKVWDILAYLEKVCRMLKNFEFFLPWKIGQRFRNSLQLISIY